MKSLRETRFSDQKAGFRQILADPHWLAKVLLGGFLLINPFLVALAPTYFSGKGPVWVNDVFPWILGFNVLSFWFPLGFTFEVLRRPAPVAASSCPTGAGPPRYLRQGRRGQAHPGHLHPDHPGGSWMGADLRESACDSSVYQDLLTMAIPPIMLFVIPFCGVACCRWLDGASSSVCALDSGELPPLSQGCPDYLLAAAFIVGVNSITTAFFYTIPFGAVFGLCLVDTWFGPIYAESVATRDERLLTPTKREPAFEKLEV